MKKKLLIALLLICASGLVVGKTSRAQEDGGRGVSISPLSFELTANPGDVLVNKFKVFNPNKDTIDVAMEIEDFRPVGEEGEVVVMSREDEAYSLKKWITINPEKFTLDSKGQQFVEFTVNVPENAEPGGKYGTILATLGGNSGEEGGSAIAQKVGALILLSISGEAKEALDIEEIIVPSFSEYGPVPIAVRFSNTGTVHVRPRGFVVINSWRDKKVADIEFSQKNVIPGAIRKVESSWEKKWLFGKYNARVVGNYGVDANSLYSPVVYFWVVPWKITLAVGAGLLIIIFFFYKTRRRWQLMLRVLFKGEKKENTDDVSNIEDAEDA